MLAAAISIFLLAALWSLVIFVGLPWQVAAVTTAALASAWLLFLAWRYFQSRRAAGQIEKALAAQADAQAGSVRPDQREDIEAMQAEFQKALAALKGSKLGRGGRNALALLPWYMIVGPPGSGKSTALRASGLKFPYLSKRGGVRGVGGTRNCEWWLTNEAVLLDTAGRYATQDEDHEEWMSFLDMLARARPRKPVNGLIVAVPVTDLSGETEENAAELGRQMRERVDEVMARLRMVLPVYVLLTKADLLPGFVETFADLRKADRGQPWGFTLPLAEGGEPGEALRERFDELVAALEERSLRRLGEERQVEGRERIYEFPQQLEAVRGPLASFVEALFSGDVYRETPMFRGLYLTSGTQEGRVIDRVMTAMAEAFGVRPAVAESQPVMEARSYFLRDVFSKVIFPDRELAVRSNEGTRLDKLRRWGLVAAAALVALFVVTFPVRSFLLNRDLIQSTGAVVEAVAGRLAPGRDGPPPLAELEPMRQRLDLLVRYDEEGPPWAMRFGMYRGGELLPHLRRLYAAAVRRLLLDPVFRQDVDEMDAFVRRLESSTGAPATAEYGRYYDKLRLHLLLTAPKGLREPKRIGDPEQAWVGQQIAERWSAAWSTAADPGGPRLIGQNAQLFAHLLDSDPTLALPRYEDLVRRERRVLARLPAATLALERIAADLDGKGYDLTLARMLGGPALALRANAGVRGAFTRRAYEEVVKGRLDDPSDLIDVWVLAGDDKEGEGLADAQIARLRSDYFGRYIEEWQRFLESVSVETESMGPLALMQELTRGEPALHGRFFRAVADNTRIAGALAKAGEGAVRWGAEKLQKALGVKSATREIRGAEAALGPGDVERAFAGFVAFGVHETGLVTAAGGAAPGAGAPSRNLSLDAYVEQLVSIREALQFLEDGGAAGEARDRMTGARGRVKSLLDAQPDHWRFRLERLLMPPVEKAVGGAIAVTNNEVARKWCEGAARPFSAMSRRYPFARDGEDIPLADVAELFRPATGRIWSVYGESLKGSVERVGDGFRFNRQSGGSRLRPELLSFLRRAQTITSALFPSGASEPTVTYSVRVRPSPRVAAIFLDLDGQRIEYRNTPEEWRKLTWPGPNGATGASLRVRTGDGQEESLQRDGEWGLFHLLEAATLRGAREFTASFRMPALGVVVNIDFRPARSETPFFGWQEGVRLSLLEPLRGGSPVPMQIANGAGACR